VLVKVACDDEVEILPAQVDRSGCSACRKERNGSADKQEQRANAQQHDRAFINAGGDLGLG
jgi:hypothetical protein